MEIKAVIVEDELPARETLELYLAKYCPEVNIIATADNVNKALEVLRLHSPDLVFLDVELPYGNAFDLLEKVGAIPFETVFITAYQQYAMKALNSNAVHYILKPVEIDELIKAVDKVKRIYEERNALEHLEIKHIKDYSANQNKKFIFPHLYGFDLIELNKIVLCKADDNYTEFSFLDGNKLLISRTLKKVEEQLSEYGFFRVHKKYLINLNHIKSYRKGKAGSLIMIDNSEVLISPNRKTPLMRMLE